MTDIITTAACPHCGSGASWRRALPTTGGRPVRLCTVCGRVSVDEDWTVPAGAEPARALPSREEIAARMYSWEVAEGDSAFYVLGPGPRAWWLGAADAILALLADQPTVEQVKAEAWNEAAEVAESLDFGPAPLFSFAAAHAWGANAAAKRIRERATQPTPVFEAMGLETAVVPSVGGEQR